MTYLQDDYSTEERDEVAICVQMMRDGMRPEEAGPLVFGVELWSKMMEIMKEEERAKRKGRTK